VEVCVGGVETLVKINYFFPIELMLGVLAMKLTAQTVVGESKVPPNGGRILN
jgi:hypothetical protein